MRACTLLALCIVSLSASACGDASTSTYTLYRNSPFGGGVRVHWGTFDATESDPAYNLNNCQMAARVLNANIAVFAKSQGKDPEPGVGFWCEPGRFKENGSTPASFQAAFPTDV